jgi:hypothetical protein
MNVKVIHYSFSPFPFLFGLVFESFSYLLPVVFTRAHIPFKLGFSVEVAGRPSCIAITTADYHVH